MDGEDVDGRGREGYGHRVEPVRRLGATNRTPAEKGVPVLLCALLGAGLGLIGARYLLVGSALSLLPWGIVAVAIGLTSTTRIEMLTRGGCYGFALAFVFMLGGYTGHASVAAELLLFAALGLFGSVCAVLLSYAGYRGSERVGRSSDERRGRERPPQRSRPRSRR